MKTNTTTTTDTWTQSSPFGKLVISVRPDGTVTRVHLNGSRHAGRTMRAGAATPAPAKHRTVGNAFDRYFAGDAHALDGLNIDLSDVDSDFQRKVLTTLYEVIKPGMTISYGELAELAGYPGAARAVGATMASNPIPIIIACHRVLASDGSLHNYGGGLDMKRKLLTMEGVQLSAKGKRL